ncbi:MAG TPA: glycosyltransferase [Steroidobacteraceae bacterium]|nr:glycosyltransferase [Steroidobacteraceae bacterium]
MRVLLVIDHFGSGGAQRQMVELACGLAARGHSVEVFVYFPQYDFFRSRLEAQRIPVHEYPKDAGGSLAVVRGLASVLRKGAFDVVAAYQSTANLYAELARLAAPSTRLVVSERTSYHDDRSAIGALARRLLHLLADRVVANSRTQARWLATKPWLTRRVACIYNGVDLEAFRPAPGAPESPDDLRLVGIGRIGPEKNLLNLVAALGHFERQFGYVPQIGWAGGHDESEAGTRYRKRLEESLAKLPRVAQRWHWLGLQNDVPALLSRYHALVHPSWYEGLPNAVCEALAAGMPVLASSVCDHPLLVAEGQRGFLFDPADPRAIAAAIARLAALDAAGWRAFGVNAREYAVANLGLQTMVNSYERLFGELARVPVHPAA